ncbi:MAG: hypothetical protein KGM24_04185 [Elusimicrobia bacterium]|nr:hypothetical protein [Elusimicrobiota bacterium]
MVISKAMRKRWLALVAALVLGSMAFHGLVHGMSPHPDDCPACAIGAAKTSASPAPAVVRVETAEIALEPPPAPSERGAEAPLPTARPPPQA